MECHSCGSDRILQISAKCNDMCSLIFKSVEYNGYVPNDSIIGGGDYIELDICLECGVAQGCSDEEDPQFYTETAERQSENKTDEATDETIRLGLLQNKLDHEPDDEYDVGKDW